MNGKLESLREQLIEKKGERRKLEEQTIELKDKIRKAKFKALDIEKAQAIIQTVAEQTHNQLKFRITEPVSLALAAVWGQEEAFTLELEFPMRRNQTECDMYFGRDGELYEPTNSTGGGVVDVAAFALRPALLRLVHPSLRPVLILDEPLKWLDSAHHKDAADMLATVSKELGIQMIITTHTLKESLVPVADKVFEVTINNGVSKVEEIG